MSGETFAEALADLSARVNDAYRELALSFADAASWITAGILDADQIKVALINNNTTNMQPCPCRVEDVTTVGDATRKTILVPDPSCPVHAYLSGDDVVLDEYQNPYHVPFEVDAGEPAPEAAWGCCDAPKPRVADGSGRFFCANCKKYLDGRP